VRMSMEADLEMIALLDVLKNRLELHVVTGRSVARPGPLRRIAQIPSNGTGGSIDLCA